MESLDRSSNSQLLSHFTGKTAADALMQRFGGLTDLAQASFEDLQCVKGIGKSKAAAIKSAFLLAQRLVREVYPAAPLMDTPERVADLLREENRVYTVEHFQVVFLNTRKRMIAVQNLSQGTLDMLLVHAREVFAPAIAKRAASIILVHNHPSGDPQPSRADLDMTRAVKDALAGVGIAVHDHLVIGRKGHASFKAMGLL